MELDLSNLSQEARSDYAHYGIVPGPRYNNFNVCDSAEYVCSFEVQDWKGPPESKVWFEAVYDLYVVNDGHEQSYVLRESEEYAGSYGSGPISTLFNVRHKPWSQALHILLNFGVFSWTKSK